eukprot:s36_g23.t4
MLSRQKASLGIVFVELPHEEAEEADVEAKAKRPRTDGVGVPPLFSQGGYSEASDGWWAHSGGEWLHNKSEMAYFHLPTGQIRVVLDESAELPAPANGKEQVEDEGPLLRGRVRWFNEKKGFGFIEPIDDAAKVLDKDLFVHRNQITGAKNGEAEGEAEVFASLQAEEVVTFHLGQTDDGRMCAVRVKVAEADADEAEPQDGDAEDGDGEDASEASSVEIDLEEELKCGFHQDKAEGKETCEDYLVEKLKLPINVLGETATFVFFGVFDGHGGPYCAEHVSTHLAKNILARLRDRARNVSDEIAVKTALLGGFKQTEHNYLQHAKKTDDSSGSTACTMTVFGPDEQMRLRLFMANCGDSRAVLCTSGTAQRLTEDHKPNLPAEKKRIEAADGGVVEVQGVWRCVLPQKKRLTSKIAGLAVSRSFGDKDFKGPDIVSAEPEITVHEVDWDADEFVILATDGIWDVLSDKDSVALVRQHLQSGKTEEKAAEALVKRAREKGSQDDCTALVVRFSWANKGQQTDAAEPDEGQVEEADAAAAGAGAEEMEDFAKRLEAKFGKSSAYEVDAVDQERSGCQPQKALGPLGDAAEIGPWRHGSIKVDGVCKVAPVVALLAGDPSMLPTVDTAVRVVQNTDKAAAFACGFARVLEKLVLGTPTVQEAIAAATKDLMDPSRSFKTALDQEVAQNLERVIGELSNLSHADAGKKLKPEAEPSYVEAVEASIVVGGCTVSRASIAGACYGSIGTEEEIPAAWVANCGEGFRIKELAQKLVGEEGEEEMMDDDEEAEAEALARMARAMAANAGAVLGPDGEEEDASSSQAAPQKQAEDRDIFADGETEEQDEEAAGLKRWDKTNAAGALISPLFEGLGPTREELAAGQDGQDGQDGRGTVIGGLLKDVGGDKADTEKPPEAKEAVDADMDMFG